MQHCFNSLRAIISVLPGIAGQHMCEIVYANALEMKRWWRAPYTRSCHENTNEMRKGNRHRKKEKKKKRIERKSQIDTINGSRTRYTISISLALRRVVQNLFLICWFFHRKWLRNQLTAENFILLIEESENFYLTWTKT